MNVYVCIPNLVICNASQNILRGIIIELNVFTTISRTLSNTQNDFQNNAWILKAGSDFHFFF
jgi:hypothetical protein